MTAASSPDDSATAAPMTAERLATIRQLADAFASKTIVAELLAEVDRLQNQIAALRRLCHDSNHWSGRDGRHAIRSMDVEAVLRTPPTASEHTP